jgi:hypothetical protein
VKNSNEKNEKVEPKNTSENYSQSIKFGIEALQRCNIPLEEEEEEEEEVKTQYSNEKNPFIEPFLLHALPFIIGSQTFFEDELCGLKEDEMIPDSEEEEEEEEAFVETPSVQPSSGGIPHQPDYSQDHMFGETEDTFDDMFAPPKQENMDFNTNTTQGVSDEDFNDLFSTKKPSGEEEEDFDLFSTKARKEEDFDMDIESIMSMDKKQEKKEENELFTQDPEEKKSKGMFDLDSDDDELEKTKKKVPLTKSNADDFFSSENTDDLFSDKKKNTKKSSDLFSEPVKKEDDFGDLLDVDSMLDSFISPTDNMVDDFTEKKKKKNKKETKDSSMFSFGEEDEEEKVPEKKKDAFQSNIIAGLQKNMSGGVKSTIPKKKESSSLFSVDEEDDEFEKKVEKKQVKESSLFSQDEDDMFEEPPKKETPKETKKKESSLFSMGEEEDEFEVKPEKKQEDKKDTFQSNIIAGLQKNMSGGVKSTIPKKKESSSLFSVDEEDEVVPEVKTTPKKKESPSLFSVDEEDEKKETKSISKRETVEKSLFSEDDDDIFQKKSEPKKSETKSSSLFSMGDDDDFTGIAKKKETKVEPKKSETKSSSLFSMGDDDFTSSVAPKKKETKKEDNPLFSSDDEVKEEKKSKVFDKRDAFQSNIIAGLQKNMIGGKVTIPKKKESSLFSEDEEEEENTEKKTFVKEETPKDAFKSNIIAGLQRSMIGAGMPPIKRKESKTDSEVVVKDDISNSSRDGASEKPVLEHSNLSRAKSKKKRPPTKKSNVALPLDEPKKSEPKSTSLFSMGEDDNFTSAPKKQEPKKDATSLFSMGEDDFSSAKKVEPKKVEPKKETPSSLFSSEEDFSSAPKKVETNKVEPKKETPSSLFSAPVVDEPKKETPPSTVEEPKKEKKSTPSLFSEDESFEIFEHKKRPKEVKEKKDAQAIFNSMDVGVENLLDAPKKVKSLKYIVEIKSHICVICNGHIDKI